MRPRRGRFFHWPRETKGPHAAAGSTICGPGRFLPRRPKSGGAAAMRPTEEERELTGGAAGDVGDGEDVETARRRASASLGR
jgi:hypothetical protein